MTSIQRVRQLVRDLWRIVGELESLFPGRKFTLDGHLLGSIGEVLAAHQYGLKLLHSSHEAHDAKAPGDRLVQIKVTQRGSVGIQSEPQHLLVLRISPDGRTEEVFNGPGQVAWSAAGKMQKNGQRPISVTKLRALMGDIRSTDQLPIRHI